MNLDKSCDSSEMLQSIEVGLLCVQQYPEDRPNMSSVVLMLSKEGILLPQAKQPGFFAERNAFDAECSSNIQVASSQNDISITLPHPR